jgi:hypothetical protein
VHTEEAEEEGSAVSDGRERIPRSVGRVNHRRGYFVHLGPSVAGPAFKDLEGGYLVEVVLVHQHPDGLIHDLA